jgi:hypothetical protein
MTGKSAREPSGPELDFSPTKRQKLRSQKTPYHAVSPPPPLITSTYSRPGNVPASHMISPNRMPILQDLKILLKQIRHDITKCEEEYRNADTNNKASCQTTIQGLKRRMAAILASMGFLHIMEDATVEIYLAIRATKPFSFPSLFVNATGRTACSILNYCKWTCCRHSHTIQLTIFPGLEKGPSENDVPTEKRVADTEKAQEQVGQWYGGRCVLTSARFSESCHIVPQCVDRPRIPRPFTTFWEDLAKFLERKRGSGPCEYVERAFGHETKSDDIL